MIRAPYAALAMLGLFVACSTVSWISTVEDRGDELRSAMTQAVRDPKRRAVLLQRIDAMEKSLLATVQAGDSLHRNFVAASVEPSVSKDRLRTLAGKIAENRRDGMRRFLSARIELRRRMTPAEWTVLTDALPAFDGGPK